VFKLESGRLVPGLLFENGTYTWLPYRWINKFYEDKAVVDNGRNMGYIDRNGTEIIPLIYLSADDFSQGRAFTSDAHCTFLIDSNGRIIRKWEESFVNGQFKNGTALLSRLSSDGEWTEEALINRDGEFITEFAPKRKIHTFSDIHIEMDTEDWYEGIMRKYDGNKIVLADLFGNCITTDLFCR
jgi:hypothetical protein